MYSTGTFANGERCYASVELFLISRLSMMSKAKIDPTSFNCDEHEISPYSVNDQSITTLGY